jgi:Reverse transcriptase (RNA-dependent DNA polymerase)
MSPSSPITHSPAISAPVVRTATPLHSPPSKPKPTPITRSPVPRPLNNLMAPASLAPVVRTATPHPPHVAPTTRGLRPNTTQLTTLVTPCDTKLLPSVSLKPKAILHHLRNYPDPTFPQLLADISRFGVRVGYEGPSNIVVKRQNHRSAEQNPSVIDKTIAKELSAGRIREITPPKSNYCSPIGLVPKKKDGVQTGWRMIFDLSCPHGASVNDHIPARYGTLDYESFQHALKLVASAGPHSVLLKKDLKAAFRHIPTSPHDYWLFVFYWKGKHYVDMFLPFGLRTAPHHFNLFAEGLHWIFVHEYGWSLTHYLDDMLSAFPPGTDPRPHSELYNSVCKDLGIETEPAKDEMGTRVTHLGLTIDTAIMEASLPLEKRNRAIQLVQESLQKPWLPRGRLDELLGFLGHCCQVIPIGRPFLRNIFNLLQVATLSSISGHPYARSTMAARRDLQWWLLFLNLWSCSIPIQTIDARRTFRVATDASGTKGIGGVFGKLVFAARLPRGHRKKHINWKEMYAIYYALLLWCNHWQNNRVIIYCDNTTVVGALTKRSVRGSTIDPLQAILLIAALFNIDLVTQWIPTDDNFVADALSRHDFKRLANYGYVEQAAILHRPHPSIPTSTLRQRLLVLCGMESPHPPANPTPQRSPSSTPSPNATNSPPSRSSSKLSFTGSPTSRPKCLRRQSATTSKAYDTTTSNTELIVQSSTSTLWNLPSEGGDVSMVTSPLANASPSPQTSSSPSCAFWPQTPPSMQPTSKRPFVLASQHSSARASSLGTGGILTSLLEFIYQGNTSHSSKTVLCSSSHPPKRISSAKASRSTSRASTHHSARSPLSIISSNATRPPQNRHCSFDRLAYLSTVPTSSTELKVYSCESASTHRNILDIHSAKAPPSPPSQLVSRKTRLNYWAGGKATQSTYTSTKSTNCHTQNGCLPSIHKSSNPSTPKLSPASSTTSRSTKTLPNPKPPTHLACRVRGDSSVLSS